MKSHRTKKLIPLLKFIYVFILFNKIFLCPMKNFFQKFSNLFKISETIQPRIHPLKFFKSHRYEDFYTYVLNQILK